MDASFLTGGREIGVLKKQPSIRKKQLKRGRSSDEYGVKVPKACQDDPRCSGQAPGLPMGLRRCHATSGVTSQQPIHQPTLTKGFGRPL